ncbi:MAG: hypothetical protein WBY44_25595 [Bryobacteraceae bacterium]
MLIEAAFVISRNGSVASHPMAPGSPNGLNTPRPDRKGSAAYQYGIEITALLAPNA